MPLRNADRCLTSARVSRLFKSRIFCDLQIICKNAKVTRAHQVILGTYSDKFLKVLFQDLGPLMKDHITIILPDFDQKDIERLLKLLYQGETIQPQSCFPRMSTLLKTLQLNLPVGDIVGTCVENLPPKNSPEKEVTLSNKFCPSCIYNTG